MAQSKRLVVQLGNGGTPTETFAFTCGANSWTVTMENSTGETMMLDCTSPLDSPATMERWVESQTTAINMTGNVTTEAWDVWRAWCDTGSTKNCKIVFDESGANGGGHWIVPMILDSLELGKEGKGVVTFTASMSSSGTRTWTDAT